MSAETRRTTRRTQRQSTKDSDTGSQTDSYFVYIQSKSAKLTTTPKVDRSPVSASKQSGPRPDIDQLHKLCQGYLSRAWLQREAESKSIFAEVDPKTKNWMSALFFTEGDMPRSTYITLCAVPGHGKSTFLEFVKRFRPHNIVIDSIPSAVNFWRKIGFRVIQNCNEAEDEIISKMLEKWKPPQSTFYFLVDTHQQPFSDKQMDSIDDQLKERNALADWKDQKTAYRRLRKFKEGDGLRMLWCQDK